MYEQTLAEVLWQAVRETIRSSLIYLPLTIGGILIFVCGWIIAGLIGQAVERLLNRIGLDHFLGQIRWFEPLERLGVRIRAAYAIGAIIRWFIIFLLLSSVAEALRLSAGTTFLQFIVNSLPSLFSAILILLIGALLADFLGKLVWLGASVVHPEASHFLKNITRAALWIFSLVAAVEQLGLAAELLQTFIIGLAALLAIAGGIAFGLSGRDYASHLIDKVYRDINQEHE